MIKKIIQKKSYVNKPYPHIVIENFLKETDVDLINKALEKSKDCFHHHGWKGKRSSVQFGTNEYENIIRDNRILSVLHNELISKSFVSEIFKVFKKDFSKFALKKQYHDLNDLIYNTSKYDFVIGSSFFKKFILKMFYNPILRRLKLRKILRSFFSIFVKSTIYPGISLSRSIGGYTEVAHTDSRHKMFVGLIYLDELKKGGELNILTNKHETDIKDCKQYLEKENQKIVKKLKPSKGKLVLFLNSNNAYHSVESFKGLRRFIYFSFAINNTESLFKTNYNVVLSDIGPNGKI